MSGHGDKKFPKFSSKLSKFPLDVVHESVTLRNGLCIHALEAKGTKLACVELVIRKGENEEVDASMLQLCHLTEHMLDRLTSKRHPNHQEIEDFISHSGVYVNAHVNPHETCFVLEGLDESVAQGLHYLIHCYMDPALDPTVFTAEQHSIVEELRAKINHSQEFFGKIQNFLPSCLSQKTGFETKAQNVLQLTFEDICKWVTWILDPKETLLILIGPQAKKWMKKWAPVLQQKRYFPSVPVHTDRGIRAFPWWSIPNLTILDFQNAFHDRLVFVFPIHCTLTDQNKRSAIEAWTRIIADHSCMASRLMKLLRTELGTVYSLQKDLIFHPWDEHQSFLLLQVDCLPSFTNTVLYHTLKSFRCLYEQGITPTEYKRHLQNVQVEEERQRANQTPSRFLQNYREHLIWKGHFQSNEEKWSHKFCSLEQLNTSLRSILPYFKIFYGQKV